MKRKNRFKNQEAEGEPEFQVAPMADVLFVLLIFFISITSTEVLRKEAGLELPNAQKGTEGKKNAGQVVINLLWFPGNRSSIIKIDSQKFYDPSSIIPLLQERIASNPLTRVLVRADKDVEYSYVADIMRACAAANIGNVTFAVLTGGESEGAKPGGS
jgi:biopolymer transport protein ExbD